MARRATAEPVLGRPGLRLLVALALVGQGLAAVAASWMLLLFISSPEHLIAALALLVGAGVTATAIVPGCWWPGWARSVQLVAAAATLALVAAAGGVAAASGHEALAGREALGVPPEEVAFWLVAVAAVLTTLAALAVSLPTRMRRTRIAAIVAPLLVGAVAATAAGGALAASDRCATFELDRERWRAALADDGYGELSDAERMADAIVACRTVEGRSRAEVRELLGSPNHGGRGDWRWVVGWVNDGIGPGDGQELIVGFDHDGRAYPPELLHDEGGFD